MARVVNLEAKECLTIFSKYDFKYLRLVCEIKCCILLIKFHIKSLVKDILNMAVIS